MRPVGVGNRSIDQGTKYYVLLFFFASVPLAVARRAVLSEAKKKKGNEGTAPYSALGLFSFVGFFSPLPYLLPLSEPSLCLRLLRLFFLRFLPSYSACVAFAFFGSGCPLLSQSSLIAAPPLGAAAGVAYSSCLPLSAGVAYSSRLRLPVAPPLRIAAGVLVLRVFLRPRADLLVLRLLAGFLLFRLPASVYLCVRLLALGMLSLLIFP